MSASARREASFCFRNDSGDFLVSCWLQALVTCLLDLFHEDDGGVVRNRDTGSNACLGGAEGWFGTGTRDRVQVAQDLWRNTSYRRSRSGHSATLVSEAREVSPIRINFSLQPNLRIPNTTQITISLLGGTMLHERARLPDVVPHSCTS